MNIELVPKKSNELIPTEILFQTDFWGRVKKRLGWKPLAFDLDFADSYGDVLVLTREIADGLSMAYVPHGPEQRPEAEKYGLFLEGLSNELVRHLDSETAFIRYDLPWPDQYSEPDGNDRPNPIIFHRPEPRLQEMRMNFGTHMWNLRKSCFDFTAPDTLILDIGDDGDKILSGMKPKTRYNIRLSAKKGVRVFEASTEMLPLFYDLYQQTAARNGFSSSDYLNFSSLFTPPKGDPSSPEIHFLLAEHAEKVLAGAVLAFSGTGAIFLFGASSSCSRNLMASYAVQWHSILLAKSRGCLTYDMGAVSPVNDPAHPFYGMYRFKTGFGGRIVHRAGAWDYPLNQGEYKSFRDFETRDLVHVHC